MSRSSRRGARVDGATGPSPRAQALSGGARPVGALDSGNHKGRGTTWLVPHRFESLARTAEDDDWGGLDAQAQDVRDQTLGPHTQVFDEQARNIIAANASPDVGFDLSINPYRGCEHGCIYCYARPTHGLLNLSPGLDFETRIIAKVNAAERLRATFARAGYVPKMLNIGSVTDAYQPAERRLGITRAVLGVMQAHLHAFSVITKSAGILRDLDLIAPMAADRLAAVYVSITTLDPALARILEPRAASPERRLATIRALAEAGVPVGVSISPVIPFINEPELEHILAAAAQAGARSAFSIVLRLPWEVNPLFQHWLETHFPERAARVMARVREMHGGADYRADFATRMRGSGVWADLLRQRFDKGCARLGLNRQRTELDLTRFRRPDAGSQRASPDGQSDPMQAAAAQGSLF